MTEYTPRHPVEVVSRCPDISESFLSVVGPTVTEAVREGTLPWPGARAAGAGAGVIATVFLPPEGVVPTDERVVDSVAGGVCLVETSDITSDTPVGQSDTVTTTVTPLSTVEAGGTEPLTWRQQPVQV